MISARPSHLIHPSRCLAGALLILAGYAPNSAVSADLMTVHGKHEMAKLQFQPGVGIVDGHGGKPDLRGVNLGSWLLLEMWMLGLENSSIPDQYTFLSILTERFGADGARALMEEYRTAWIDEGDFRQIRSFGMNLVRLPIHYSIVEDDAHPFTVRPGGWDWIDRAVQWSENHGLYIILDLHGAPGGQSDDHITGRVDDNEYWGNEEYRARAAWFWQETAARYGARPAVAAYDLLNEPWGTGENELREEAFRLARAIREVDQQTIIILPGHRETLDFYGPISEMDFDNAIYTMHFYPGIFDGTQPTLETHARFLTQGLADWQETAQRLGAPIFIGEFQPVYEHLDRATTIRRHFDAYNNIGWPATIWSYRVITASADLRLGRWGMVMNDSPLPPLDLRTASEQEILQWFRAMGDASAFDDDLRAAMRAEPSPEPFAHPGPADEPLRFPPAMEDTPDEWLVVNIGGAITGGQAFHDDARFTFYAGGDNIYGNRDQFRFLAGRVSGDFRAETRVSSVSFTHMFAKAGLMARRDFSPGAAHVSIVALPTGWIETPQRLQTGGETKASLLEPLEFPHVYLALERVDASIRPGWSADGVTWQHGPAVPFTEDDLYLGFAATAHDNQQLVTIEATIPLLQNGTIQGITQEQLAASLPPPPTRDPLPESWKQIDLGGALPGGQKILDSGALEIHAGGQDIWNNFDSFRFIYHERTGPAEMTAQVLTQEGGGKYAKAGLMIRQDLAPDSPTLILNTFPDCNLQLAHRAHRGSPMAAPANLDSHGTQPYLRLRRNGPTAEALVSTDGSTWESLGTLTLPWLETAAYWGLATSSNSTELGTASYRIIETTPAAGHD